jgi:hypothetical protein
MVKAKKPMIQGSVNKRPFLASFFRILETFTSDNSSENFVMAIESSIGISP